MYHQGNRPGSNKKPSGPKSFSKKPGTTTTTFHKATCNTCGNPCQVPFRPTGTKPVLCNACFQHQENPKKGSKTNFNDQPKTPLRKMMTAEQFETLNKKLDKILTLLNES